MSSEAFERERQPLPRGTLVLKQLQKHCFVYADLHRAASQHYARSAAWLTVFNLFWSIATLFLASNAVAKAVIKEFVVHTEALDIGEFAISVAGAMVVFSAALQYLLKWEERNLIHKYVGADYDNLVRKISRFLAKDHVTDYEIHRINRQVNYIERHSPPISTRFSKEMKAAHAGWQEFNGGP